MPSDPTALAEDKKLTCEKCGNDFFSVKDIATLDQLVFLQCKQCKDVTAHRIDVEKMQGMAYSRNSTEP
jgi:transcription elongation factor Elf1